ncbi:RsiV family protein [Rhodovulum sp. DZ06]|uniref:RsiV family protein n=1 Tax=Rhodovulum sp. DZ06 TaxID=3425126 RepID=UPI003D34017C
MIREAILAAALALSALPAGAESGTAPNLDWEVTRDPAIAAAAPKLAAFLAAETADLLHLARDEAAEAAARAAEDGRTPRRQVFKATEAARAVTPRFVSVLRTTERYQGGAHGGLWFDALTWDKTTGDVIGLDLIFPPTREGARGLEALVMALKADLLAREGLWRESIAYSTPLDPAALGNFTLEPSTQAGRIGGIAFHYAPYELGPFALGPQTAVIPQAVFADGVAPEFQRLFGGAPAR